MQDGHQIWKPEKQGKPTEISESEGSCAVLLKTWKFECGVQIVICRDGKEIILIGKKKAS